MYLILLRAPALLFWVLLQISCGGTYLPDGAMTTPTLVDQLAGVTLTTGNRRLPGPVWGSIGGSPSRQACSRRPFIFS